MVVAVVSSVTTAHGDLGAHLELVVEQVDVVTLVVVDQVLVDEVVFGDLVVVELGFVVFEFFVAHRGSERSADRDRPRGGRVVSGAVGGLRGAEYNTRTCVQSRPKPAPGRHAYSRRSVRRADPGSPAIG